MDADQPEPGRDAPAGTGLPRRRLLRAGRAAGIGGLAGMLGLAVGNATSVAEDGRHVAVGGTGAPGTVHVSDQGDDRNDGLSWASPLRSVASGLARLRGGPGTVEVGPGQFEETALTMDVHQSIRGRGPHSTVVQLAESGTLFDLSDVQYCRLEDIGLQFTNSSVSGTLMDMANTFTCTFRNVRFSGTNAPDQVGVHLRDNAGDSTFLQSFIAELDVGVQVDTAVNYFIGCTSAPTGWVSVVAIRADRTAQQGSSSRTVRSGATGSITSTSRAARSPGS